jgi:hypothetical protein
MKVGPENLAIEFWKLNLLAMSYATKRAFVAEGNRKSIIAHIIR